MKMDTYEAYDILSLKVNGRTVKKFSGEMDWFTYAIPAEADGDVVLTLTYDRTSAYNYDVEFLWIDSVAVLSGEEAAAALAANPVYPVSDAFSVTPLSPNAREIVARGDVSLNDLLSVNRAYIIPGEQRTSFAVTVGPEADPDADIIVTDNDGEATLLRDAVRDGGYVVTTGFDSMSDTGYSYADVNVYWNGLEETEGVLYFTDEANANYFFYVMLPMYGFNMTWTYTDGTAPDRDILPEEMADTEADDGISTYTARCVDAEGNPVAGVTLQVCDANSCELFTTEESGEVTWSSLAYPYEVHILLLSQGYEGDTQSTWVFPEAGGEIVINLTLK